MPRTSLTPIASPDKFATSPATLPFTAADVPNKNQVLLTGREIVIARNVDGANPHNMTVSSVALNNRTGDLTQAIPASGFVVTQIFPTQGWQQSDGNLFLEADDVQIEFAVVKLP